MNPKFFILMAVALSLYGCSKKSEEQRTTEALSNAVAEASSALGDKNDTKWPVPPKDAPMGRLGLEPEELAKIWGQPLAEMEPQQPAQSAKRYAHAGYDIVVHFLDGKSCMINVTRLDGDLTESELLSLLETVSGKAGWPSEGFRRVRSDGSCVLQIVGFNSHALIYTRSFWETEQKAKEDTDRQRAKKL
jgi:hypothetical protein